MSQSITLYDLKSRAPLRAWSGNAWKTRLLFNYKQIPYTTHWVTYTKLASTLTSLGLPPNPPGSWADYTVPAVQLPDGTYMMDSAVIATRLESLFPERPLHFNPEIEAEAGAAVGALWFALVRYLMPIGVKTLVAEEDVDWFVKDRARRFGITEEALLTPGDLGAALKGAEGGFEKVREVLTKYKRDDGPFILGSQVSYADFVIVATVQTLKQGAPEALEELLKAGPRELRELYEACEEWRRRDD